MTTKFDTALTALQTKVRAQAKALKKNEEEEATRASTRLIESGVFDDDTLATVTKESLVADGFAPGLADWFVSTFGTKTAIASTLPAEIVLKREKEEDPNDLPLADLLAKVDFAKRDRYYACASTKAGGQKCFVFEGAKLLIEPTIALLTKVSQGRRVPASVTVGKEVYYPRTIAQGPITPEEEWSVNPFFPAEPLSDDDTCDMTGLSMKDVQSVTRSILILAQTRTFEQQAFTVHDVETRIESFKGDAGVRNAKRYYPKAGSFVAQGTTVPLKKSAKSFRESSASPARRPEVSDDDAEVHPVTPQANGDTNNSPQQVIPGDWIGSIYTEIIALGLADRRSTLLTSIHPGITSGLRVADPASTIMMDISGLNFVDATGNVPLCTYLKNAVHLKGSTHGSQMLAIKRAVDHIMGTQRLVYVLASPEDKTIEKAAIRQLGQLKPRGVGVRSRHDCLAGIDHQSFGARSIQQAGAVVVLVTSDLLADPDMMDLAQQAMALGKCIPIYARPCMYESSPFAGKMCIPASHANALSAMSDQDSVWQIIVQCVARKVGLS